LSGLDLKVGGEGMIKFYDEMLPKKAQKIARRLDQNAKVGIREIDGGEEVYSIINEHGVPIGHDYTRAQAQHRLDNELQGRGRMKFESGGSHKVWSIDITPAMRKSIAGGQPLFSNPAAAAAPGLLSTQQPQRRIPRSLLDDAA
jgi:hypothetical protein